MTSSHRHVVHLLTFAAGGIQQLRRFARQGQRERGARARLMGDMLVGPVGLGAITAYALAHGAHQQKRSCGRFLLWSAPRGCDVRRDVR